MRSPDIPAYRNRLSPNISACSSSLDLFATDAKGVRPTTVPTREGLAPLIDWMKLYGTFWHDRIDRLESLLNRMDQ